MNDHERIKQLEYALDGILESSPYDFNGKCVYCGKDARKDHKRLCRYWVAGKIRKGELVAIVMPINAGYETPLNDETREVAQNGENSGNTVDCT